MEEIIIKQSGEQKHLKFKAELIASVTEATLWIFPSGNKLELYRTESGKFFCKKSIRITYELKLKTLGCVDHTRKHYQFFDTQGEVVKYFGHSKLAKKLYAICEWQDEIYESI